jgi:DNA polymerase I-like protein with 3'-5' exonuclease and polymerase domains
MAKAHPKVAPLYELRMTLSELKLNQLAVGRDGRNRPGLLGIFGTKTSRNAPSSTRYAFGPARWIRGLIKPPPGWAVAYCDWKSQEFAIGAWLSRDQAMMDAYTSGDPYLAFGKQAGLIPQHGTKQTHATERALCKTCVLGVGFGMGADALASRIGKPPICGRELLAAHRRVFWQYWDWQQRVLEHAMMWGYLRTCFGWTLHITRDTKPRTITNFLLQAHGAEMLRLATCLLTERGIEVHGPVHDAVLVGGPIDQIDSIVEQTQATMVEAAKIVLEGFAVGVDAHVVRYPDRYMDAAGQGMWDTVMEILGELIQENEVSAVPF